MHATNLGSQPPFTYMVEDSYLAMDIVHQCREAGYPCYFTMDAGPNVKILVEKKNQQAVIDALKNHLMMIKLLQVTLHVQVLKLLSKEEIT